MGVTIKMIRGIYCGILGLLCFGDYEDEILAIKKAEGYYFCVCAQPYY